MKAHIGLDIISGLVHSVEGAAANVADVSKTGAVLQEKKVIFSPPPVMSERRNALM